MSLHIPRVYLADLHALSRRYDIASYHARIYLRQCKDNGKLKNIQSSQIVREGVSRAFLLLTSVYTEIGARSYSERVLRFALKYSLSEKYKDHINKELRRLEEEKQNSSNRELNNQWEQFFLDGSYRIDLYKMCISKKSPLLAKRVDLWEGNFRYNSEFSIDEEEILTLVLETDENLFIVY